jgi:hypothetical protein
MTANGCARALACVAALGAWIATPRAWAEPASNPAAPKPTISVETPPPPPPVERTYHVHDGFYLRLSLGGAWSSTSQGFANGASGDTLSGGGGAFDVMVGGTPVRGLVIGGALLANSILEPSYELNGVSYASNSNLGFGMLAAFIDGFPDPHQGFHVGGGFGPAVVRLGARSSSNSTSTDGFGGALWLGYDAWIAPQWSLGGILRFAEARTGGGSGDLDETDVTRSIVISFTALYH